MINVKHVFDVAEACDGQRIWVEPIGLCKDLQQWCKVDHVLSHIGPPQSVWRIFQSRGDAYDFFRAKYHEFLRRSQYKPALQALACAARRETFTLIHQGDDPEHNSATALREFLNELDAYCPREDA